MLFWHDVSCGDGPLKTQFLDLFMTVQEVIFWNADHIRWNLSLLRSPNVWEEESACNVLALLAGMNVVPQGNDEIVWPL